MEIIAFIIINLILLAIYMIPALIANSREHKNTAAITALNFLLGWTFIGWVVALVWSLMAVDKVETAVPSVTSEQKES